MSKLPSGLVNEAVNDADEAEPMRSARVPIQVEVVGTSATSSRKPKGTPQQQGASARRRSNKAAEVELERQRAESKAMRKRASIDFVMNDKAALQETQRRQEAKKQHAKRVAAEKVAREKAVADRARVEQLEAERRAAEQAEEQHLAAEREAAHRAAEEARLALEAEQAAIEEGEAKAAAEVALADQAETDEQNAPAWVRRLIVNETVRRKEASKALHGEDAEWILKSPRLAALTGAAQRTAAILFAQPKGAASSLGKQAPFHLQFNHLSSVRQAQSAAANRSYAVRVSLSSWTSKKDALPRAVATRLLMLRSGPSLGSVVVGKLPQDAEVFLVETRELAPGIKRAHVTATTKSTPLGWVTASKHGDELLMVRPDTSSALKPPTYFTSLACPERLHKAIALLSLTPAQRQRLTDSVTRGAPTSSLVSAAHTKVGVDEIHV